MASFRYEFHHGYCLGIDCNVLSQSIANKTSEIEVSVFLQSLYASCTISSSGTKSLTLYVDGTPYTQSVANMARLSGNQKKTLYTWTLTIQHDEQGAHTLRLYCTANLEVTLGGTKYNTVRSPSSGSNSMALPTITHSAPALTVTASQTNSANIENYITNQSTVTLHIAATTEDGAQITSYDIAFGNDGGTGSFKYTARESSTIYDYSFLMPEITGDTVDVSVIAKDSYGYASEPYRLTLENVLHYSPPEITDIRWARGRMEQVEGEDEQFVEDVDGDRLRITAIGRISSLDGQNTKEYLAEYRVKGELRYDELFPTEELDAYEYEIERITDAVFSSDYAYDVRFIIIDSFMRVIEVLNVSSQVVLLNFSLGGDSICAGGMATYPNTFQSWLAILPSGGITAVQVLEGQSLDELTTSGSYYGEDDEGKYGLLVEQIGANMRYQRLRRYDGKKLVTQERCSINQIWSQWSKSETVFTT